MRGLLAMKWTKKKRQSHHMVGKLQEWKWWLSRVIHGWNEGGLLPTKASHWPTFPPLIGSLLPVMASHWEPPGGLWPCSAVLPKQHHCTWSNSRLNTRRTRQIIALRMLKHRMPTTTTQAFHWRSFDPPQIVFKLWSLSLFFCTSSGEPFLFFSFMWNVAFLLAV